MKMLINPTALIFVIMLLFVTTGCQQPQQTTDKPLCFAQNDKQKVFNACEKVLKDMNFTIDKLDIDNSYVSTNPLSGGELLEFWRKRDTTPETPQNEFRDNYLKLVNTANKEFSGFRDGYKSDRGRILLVYGVPDEIERFPLNMEHKEHHIWKFFSIQGGVIFIFVDKQGFGNLELVHSTARGELNDPDWERWIDPNR